MQCGHWRRHMEKASFIPHTRVANTCRTSADTLPRQSTQNTCKQVMSFTQRLKSVATPVKSAQQLNRSKLGERPTIEQIKSEGKLSKVGAIKLQTGLPLCRPMWSSSVQRRHWSRHMEKASFTPHAWMASLRLVEHRSPVRRTFLSSLRLRRFVNFELA